MLYKIPPEMGENTAESQNMMKKTAGYKQQTR